MNAEFKIMAEMLKFLLDKELSKQPLSLPPPLALLISASHLFLLGGK